MKHVSVRAPNSYQFLSLSGTYKELIKISIRESHVSMTVSCLKQFNFALRLGIFLTFFSYFFFSFFIPREALFFVLLEICQLNRMNPKPFPKASSGTIFLTSSSTWQYDKAKFPDLLLLINKFIKL